MDSLGIRICRRMDLTASLPSWEERPVIVHAVTSRFGGMAGAADMVNLLKSGDYGIAQLGKAYGDFTGAWLAKDPAGYADFTNDWMSLQARWARARVAAKSTGSVLSTGLVSGLTGGLAGGGLAYDGLFKALHQGGEGSAVQRGDFNDLVQRLTKAGGHVDLADMPHGVITPASVANAAVGMVPKMPDLPDNPFKSLEDVFKWLKDHQHELMLAGLAVGGLMLLGLVFTAVKAVPLALKGATAGVL